MTQTKKTEYEEWAAKQQDPRSTPEIWRHQKNSMRAAPNSNFDITLGESLKRANMNLSDSAHGLTNALGHMVTHPVETGGTILSLGQSLVQNLIPGEQGNEAMAQNLAKHYHDRYSSAQGFKQHFAEDPFPMLLDVAGTSALAKPIATGAINTTKAGIDATKAGISTVKSNVKFNAPDKMNPELIWHGGTLTDDVPLALNSPNLQGRGLGLHASSHTTGPIGTYATHILDRNIRSTQMYNKMSRSEQAAFKKGHKAHYGTPWDAEPTLTEFTVKNSKPFFYNQPQKDVVRSVNEQIKILKNEIKRKKKEGKKLTPKEQIAFNEAEQAARSKLGAFPSRKPLPPPPTTAYSTSGEISALNRKIGELVSLREGNISLQRGVTKTQLNILQDLGYQIIRPKHPTRRNERTGNYSSGPRGALNKNHVLIIDKNLPRRTLPQKEWEKAADRGRAQRETLGKQDMRNREKSTTATFFETLFKK